MSAVDLAASEWDESDLYEPAASTLGSRYKRIIRSRSSTPLVSAHPSSDLTVNKLEVKPQPAGRSGLLAAQLKGYVDLKRAASALLCRNLQAFPVLQVPCAVQPASLSQQ